MVFQDLMDLLREGDETSGLRCGHGRTLCPGPGKPFFRVVGIHHCLQLCLVQIQVCLLDLNVRCQDGLLSTGLYRKPTATNNVLEYNSFHPLHTKRGVPVSQFLRTRRNCTSNSDFRKEARDLTARIKRRAYPNKCISQAYQRASLQSQASLLKSTQKPSDKSVRFITGFNTHLSQGPHLTELGNEGAPFDFSMQN
ncbi:uncharacterized protein [Ranitomeya imitator]|uniref:uncharacterized protein isoform X2 n=1 Tax=Ranitomeya imitator TaxID=111125 RepID=UPI0037E97227